MSGACLVTPYNLNGLFDLFKENEHVFCYEKNNSESAVSVILSLLSDPKKTQHLASEARKYLLENHTAKNRAATFYTLLETLKISQRPQGFQASCYNELLRWFIHNGDKGTLSEEVFLICRNALEESLKRKEVIDYRMIFCFIELIRMSSEKRYQNIASLFSIMSNEEIEAFPALQLLEEYLNDSIRPDSPEKEARKVIFNTLKENSFSKSFARAE